MNRYRRPIVTSIHDPRDSRAALLLVRRQVTVERGGGEAAVLSYKSGRNPREREGEKVEGEKERKKNGTWVILTVSRERVFVYASVWV